MSQLDNLSQAQRERLFYIDFRLYFLGSVNRADIVTRFGLKEAAASRDLSLYRNLAPKNLAYDTVVKTYIAHERFKPLFSVSASQALSALLSGLGDDFIGTPHPLVSCEAPTQLNTPNIDTLASITRAIHNEKVLKIHYRSLSSGLNKREIVPFALVDNGLRWHVRAYDRARDRFADFVVNRIETARLLDKTIPEEQTKAADNQWNRIVDLHIVPHPKLSHPETIEMEYGMSGGELKLQLRAAVAGYALRIWNVDCSENHAMNSPAIHLWLKNTQTLCGVENLMLTPGFNHSENGYES